MMNDVIRIISNLRRTDGVLWGSLRLLRRLRVAAHSMPLRWLLSAPGLTVESVPLLRGARHIHWGRNVRLGRQGWIEAVTTYGNQVFSPHISIGDGSSASDNVHITCIDHIDIGCHVLMGSQVYIADHGHGIYRGSGTSDPATPPSRRILGGAGPVRVEDSVWIGDNVTIIGPVTIGRGAVVGANSVVRRDIPPDCIAVGSPAQPVKRWDAAKKSWGPV